MKIGYVLWLLLLLSVSVEEECKNLPAMQDYGPLISGPVLDEDFLKTKIYKLSKANKCDGNKFVVEKVVANLTNDQHVPLFLDMNYCDLFNAWIGNSFICPTFNCPIVAVGTVNGPKNCLRGQLPQNSSCESDGFAKNLYGICFLSECSPSELKFKNSYIDRKSLGSEKQIKKLRIKCRKGYVMKSDVTPKEVFCFRRRWTETNLVCEEEILIKVLKANVKNDMEKMKKTGYTGYPTMVPDKELFGLLPYYIFFTMVIAALVALRILYYFSNKLALKKAQKQKQEFIVFRNNELKDYLNNLDLKRYNDNEGPTTEMKVTEKSTVRPKNQDIVGKKHYVKSISSEHEQHFASAKDDI